jgi:hypothetical protein
MPARTPQGSRGVWAHMMFAPVMYRPRRGMTLLMPRGQNRVRHQQKYQAEERRQAYEAMTKVHTRVKTAHAREQVREECESVFMLALETTAREVTRRIRSLEKARRYCGFSRRTGDS